MRPERTASGRRLSEADQLEPFTRVATPAMNEGVAPMYGDTDKWEGQADPGFSARVFRFIQQAAAHPGMRTG